MKHRNVVLDTRDQLDHRLGREHQETVRTTRDTNNKNKRATMTLTTKSSLASVGLTLSVIIDWTNKIIFVMQFKRVSDQTKNYRKRGETSEGTEVFVRSLEHAAKETYEDECWKIRLIVFVGGTSGSVYAKTFSESLKEIQFIDPSVKQYPKGSCMNC